MLILLDAQTKRRGKNRGKPVTPMTNDLLAGNRAPAASQEFLRRYGVQSFAWGAYYEIRTALGQAIQHQHQQRQRRGPTNYSPTKAGTSKARPKSARNLKTPHTPGQHRPKSHLDEHARYWMGRLLGTID